MAKVIYTNSEGESIEFTNSRPFFLQKKEGFGAVKNNIYTQKSMRQDGVTVIGKDMQFRNIVLEGVIIGDTKEEVENNRQKMIKVFNPRFDGVLTYINGDIKKKIRCEVEYAPITIQNQQIQKYMISLLCSNPFWFNVEENKEQIAKWIGNFGFELEIPIETGIEMGYRRESLMADIYNSGDVECGMRIVFRALATVQNPSLINIHTRELIKVNKTMIKGEVIEITTDFANKKITSTIDSKTTNIFQYIDFLNSTFLQLRRGDNLFRYNADEGMDNLEIDIYYSPLYVGV